MIKFNNDLMKLSLAGLVLILALPVFAMRIDEDLEEEIEEDGRGIIADEQYEVMRHCDDISWCWVADGIQLRDYRIDVGEFENLSDHRDEDMLEELNDGFSEAFERGNKMGTLTTENVVYWSDRSNDAKRWIPFAGSHLAQAGVGVEMIFRNSDGEVVALIRHYAREGDDLEDAAEEIVEDIDDWIGDN